MLRNGIQITYNYPKEDPPPAMTEQEKAETAKFYKEQEALVQGSKALQAFFSTEDEESTS